MNNYFRRRRAASQGGAGGGDPIGDALRADALAYWKMDEASGSRADATGRGNTLSEEGGEISSVAGLVGNAAAFIGNARYLKRADGADLRFTGSWAVTFFIRLNSDQSFTDIVIKADTGSAIEAEIYVGNDTRFVSAIAGEVSPLAVGTASALNVDTWYFVAVELDITSKTLYISVDNGAQVDHSSEQYEALSGTNPFLVGIWANESDGSLDGSLQHLAKFNRILTADERAYIYNSGNGRTLYP